MFDVFSKYLTYLPYTLIGFVWGIVITPFVGWIAKKFNFMDIPASTRQKPEEKFSRRWHRFPTPRLGGVVILLPLLLSPWIFGKEPWVISFTIALVILILLGIIDDRFELSGKLQIAVLALASLIAVIGGVIITNVQNPFDSFLNLEKWPITIHISGKPFTFYILALIISILWLMLVANAMNWIDNIGGIAALSTGIATLTIFLVAVRSWDSVQAGIAALMMGTILGFLPFNIIPEKIFIGGNALALGFTVGVLSTVEKTKLSVWFIVLGFPLIDLIIVLITRIKQYKPKSLKAFISLFEISGKEHLSFRLAEAGLTKKQVLFTEFVVSLLFGVIGLALSGLWLTIGIFITCGIMIMIYLLAIHIKNKKALLEKPTRDATPEEKFAY